MVLRYTRWVGEGAWDTDPSIPVIPSGYFQLITSAGPPDRAESPSILEVFEYLEFVRRGSAGTPLCPAVEAVHQNDGYHLKIREHETPDEAELEEAAQELRREFWRLSPMRTNSAQTLDPTVVLTAFASRQCRTAAFCLMLDRVRTRLRQSFLGDGLMLSQMHELHPDGKRRASYASRIPLLIVRRMHRQDRVFMQTRQELATYESFFPANSA